MGFWHTGYIEFHEPIGWDDLLFPKEPRPIEYSCTCCDAKYLDPAELRRHRFEAHPVYRPTILIGGEELGDVTFRMTTPITPKDVEVREASTARLNGVSMKVGDLGRTISSVTDDLLIVELGNEDVEATYSIEIQVAADEDLFGVEQAFKDMVLGERLDLRTVESFVSSSSRFKTASRYADGICEYLVGVLAKEQSNDSGLKREQYLEKYNRAADQLTGFDRPVSRIIRALIAFNFNHFNLAARLSANSRVGIASERLDGALSRATFAPKPPIATHSMSSIDRLISDWETERQIVWAVKDVQDLARNTSELEKILAGDSEDIDSLKMRLLLAHTYREIGDAEQARRHARMLRNSPTVGGWAESFLLTLGG